MANKFTGITSAGVNVPVYDKEAHQALGNVYTKSEVDTELNTKQDNLSTEQLYNIDNALTTSAGLASEAWVNDQGFAKESDIPTTAGLMEESKLNIDDNHITAYNGIPFSAQGGGGGGGTVYTDSSLSGNGSENLPLGVNVPMFSEWVDVTNEWNFPSTYFTTKPNVLYNKNLKLIWICGVALVKSIKTGWNNIITMPDKYSALKSTEYYKIPNTNTFNYFRINVTTDGRVRLSCSTTSEVYTDMTVMYPCKGGV